LSGSAFQSVVSSLIGSSRVAPLVDEFKTKAVVIREKQRADQKSLETIGAESFFANKKLDDGEVKDRMDVIKKRMLGHYPDKDWNEFVKFLKEQVK